MRNLNELELLAVVGGCDEDSAEAEVVAVADDAVVADIEAVEFVAVDDSSDE